MANFIAKYRFMCEYIQLHYMSVINSSNITDEHFHYIPYFCGLRPYFTTKLHVSIKDFNVYSFNYTLNTETTLQNDFVAIPFRFRLLVVIKL